MQPTDMVKLRMGNRAIMTIGDVRGNMDIHTASVLFGLSITVGINTIESMSGMEIGNTNCCISVLIIHSRCNGGKHSCIQKVTAYKIENEAQQY